MTEQDELRARGILRAASSYDVRAALREARRKIYRGDGTSRHYETFPSVTAYDFKRLAEAELATRHPPGKLF